MEERRRDHVGQPRHHASRPAVARQRAALYGAHHDLGDRGGRPRVDAPAGARGGRITVVAKRAARPKETSMIRKAKAVWRGTGRAGNGNLSTDSGVLADMPYSFKTRFENEKGTNPEELIAAAHDGCF